MIAILIYVALGLMWSKAERHGYAGKYAALNWLQREFRSIWVVAFWPYYLIAAIFVGIQRAATP